MSKPTEKSLTSIYFKLLFIVLAVLISSAGHTQQIDGLSSTAQYKSALTTLAMSNVDECDFTAQCKAIYGDRADDCRNSQSDQSVCFCGGTACNGSNGGTPDTSNNEFPGRFDLAKDLFLAFFDNKPDADDIHSQAGVATLLSDRRFANIDFYSVLGAYGKQGGAFLNSSSVMNQCFGPSNWTNAHPKDGPNWSASLDRVQARAISTLNRGGDIWIMEAGQSDFSADLIRRLKNTNPSLQTANRIHIVQHSNYNENATTPADLSYVRANADYNKIPDGNAANNGSPQFLTRSDARWATATSLSGVGACWSEARRIADVNNFSGNGHYENPAIEAGGFDFSDVVEATWIFGFNSLANVNSFFNEFPKTGTAPTPPLSSPTNAATTAPLILLLGDD